MNHLINIATMITLRWIRSNRYEKRFSVAQDVTDLKRLIAIHLKPDNMERFAKGAKLTNWDAVYNYVKAIGALALLLIVITTPVQAQKFTLRYSISTSGGYQFQSVAKSHITSLNTDSNPTQTEAKHNTMTATVNAIIPFKKFLTPEGETTREIVLAHLAKYYSGDELIAADNILKKEAGYRYDAVNEIGAGGMPQALPYSKMGCPLTKDGIICQAQWFIGYINRRYGSPTVAWNHHLQNNWY